MSRFVKGPLGQGSPGLVRAEDINGDGLSELIVAGDGKGAVYYYEAVANFYLAETKALTNDKKSANALLTKARNIAKKIGAKDLSDEIDAFDATLNK